jgi:hypothetical protein
MITHAPVTCGSSTMSPSALWMRRLQYSLPPPWIWHVTGIVRALAGWPMTVTGHPRVSGNASAQA